VSVLLAFFLLPEVCPFPLELLPVEVQVSSSPQGATKERTSAINNFTT